MLVYVSRALLPPPLRAYDAKPERPLAPRSEDTKPRKPERSQATGFGRAQKTQRLAARRTSSASGETNSKSMLLKGDAMAASRSARCG